MSQNLTFTNDEVFNLQKMSVVGGSKEQLKFNFYNDEQEPLDITTSRVIWTLSRWGDVGYTLLTKTAVLSSDYSCIVTLLSSDTDGLDGKFIQQISIIDYQGNKNKPCQGVLLISESNYDGV